MTMTTNGSPAIQLDHWASIQAPLSESERASVNALAEYIGSGARHAVVAHQSQPPKQQAQDAQDTVADADGHENGAANAGSSAQPALPDSALADAPSYLAWYGKQQALIAASSHTEHVKALETITRAADEAESLLSHLDDARIHVAELRAGAQLVEEGTEGLREDAESMVERIDHLSQLADALALRLTYFAILPSTTSFLSSPSLSIVATTEFSLTLHRLDIALAFLEAHPYYRDSAVYKMRFEHCIVRAGTLIRMYAIGRIKDLTKDVQNELKEWEKNRYGKGKEKEFDADSHAMMNLEDPTIHALLWERFEAESKELRPLMRELERRALDEAIPATPATDSYDDPSVPDESKADNQKQKEVESEEGTHIKHAQDVLAEEEGDTGVDVFRAPEFAALLQECRTAYIEARRSLLAGIVSNCIARIEVMAQHPGTSEAGEASSKASGDDSSATARLVNRAMGFLTAMNEAETRLFGHFFDLSSRQPGNRHHASALNAHLRALAAPLDDRIKPGLASEGALAGLSSATLRSLDAWRQYVVRFLS